MRSDQNLKNILLLLTIGGGSGVTEFSLLPIPCVVIVGRVRLGAVPLLFIDLRSRILDLSSCVLSVTGIGAFFGLEAVNLPVLIASSLA